MESIAKTNVSNSPNSGVSDSEEKARKKLLAMYIGEEKTSAPEGKTKEWNAGKILRWSGGILLLVSASVFLAQNYLYLSGVGKFYAFLGFLTFLSCSGLVCLRKLEDRMGARTFVGLACALIPVLFLQLGGLIYSQFGHDLSSVPGIVSLSTDMSGLALALGIAAIPLFLMAKFAFSVFDRENGLKLTIGFLLINSSLLLPVRDAAFTAVLSVVGLLVLSRLFLSRRFHSFTYLLSLSQ